MKHIINSFWFRQTESYEILYVITLGGVKCAKLCAEPPVPADEDAAVILFWGYCGLNADAVYMCECLLPN